MPHNFISRLRRFKWFLFAALLVLTVVMGVKDDLVLNFFAINTNKGKQPIVRELSSPQLDCQVQWLSPDRDLPELLSCSPVYMDMIRDLAPTNAALATEAHALYPDLAGPLYWLAESKGGYAEPLNLPLYQQIVSEHPYEGLAWCYIGFLSERAGDLQAALDARINCCYNGDPGSNGCYNAGRLLEGKQQYQEAIRYYRLSKWGPSQEAANKLAEKIFTSGTEVLGE